MTFFTVDICSKNYLISGAHNFFTSFLYTSEFSIFTAAMETSIAIRNQLLDTNYQEITVLRYNCNKYYKYLLIQNTNAKSLHKYYM